MDEGTTTIDARPDGYRTRDDARSSYPLVTLAMVAHNPGAWFEEVLRSISLQDYPNLDVVVIDAASDISVAERVHETVPDATVVPLLANQGFAKNANSILEHPTLGPYLVICHDDVALAPDCVRRLIEEALRSNAGVVGPKLLDWDDPNRILHVGFGADKTGQISDLAEPGEYDQEQHDAVRDVFAVPGAVTLIRSDLFRALDGFDEAMVVQGEDLDLCWRAHALGARVIVNPEATARHREDLTTRIAGHQTTRFARRHRIRALLSNYGWWHTLRVVPQAFGASIVNAFIALLQGRLAVIIEIASAWWWNLRHLGSIRRRRRHLGRIRQISDAEVRALQIPGFEGIVAWRRERADRLNPPVAADAPPAEISAGADNRRWLQVSALVWLGIAIVLFFGSRGLITDEVPVFGQLARFPRGPSSLLTEWGSTWRSTGLGADSPSSLLHALLGFAGIAMFGQMGLLRLLLTVGMIAVGAIGAHRLLTPFDSRVAQLVALLVYVGAPLPYNALHGGSWSGLVVYGAMPWLAKRLAVAARIPPFGDDETTKPRAVADVVIVGLIGAAVALVEPLIVLILVVLSVGWILGALATRRTEGIGRLVVATVGALVVGFVLSMPASLAVFSARVDWSLIGGTGSTTEGEFRLSELARLASGPHGASNAGWALLVLPLLALALAFGHRLAWAARSWFAILGSVGLAWVTEQGLIDIALGDVHVLLAPAALGLAFAAGMAAMAFQRDLRRYRFGWRQAIPVVAVLAVVTSAGAGIGAAFDGRWQVVEDGYESVFSFMDTKAPAHARTLWLGDADVLPVQGWRYDDELTYSITQARTPTILDAPVGNEDRHVQQVRELVEASVAGASSRLGDELASFGIRYIVLVESNAPSPFGTIDRPVSTTVASRFTEQLDLVRIEVRPGATIYENQAYRPTVSTTTGAPTDGGAAVYNLALPEVTSLRAYRGFIAEPGELILATPESANWALDVGGTSSARSAQDATASFSVLGPGEARLTHSNQTGMWIGSLVQLGAWVIAVTTLILTRRRRT